jgi:hypothetical protein
LRPRCGRGLATPRSGTFARAGKIEKARTATRFATPCDNALDGRMVRPEMRVAVRLKKPAAGFPARAYIFRFLDYAGDLPDGARTFLENFLKVFTGSI